MQRRALAIAATIGLLSTSTVRAGAAEPPPFSHMEMMVMQAAKAGAETLPDLPGTGPYAAIKEVDATLPDHVVYRPRDLDRLKQRKLAILLWGNGGCSADGASARGHLLEIASHGYLVIAPGHIYSGPGALPPPASSATAQPEHLGVATTSADVLAGLDWALAEAKRPGSRYYNRIDPALVAVAGHSCGGLQALQVAADPRVAVVIIHNSGMFVGDKQMINGIVSDKAQLKKLHTPVLYILGGPRDVAWRNGNDDFDRIDQVPAFLAERQVGHGGTFSEPYGGSVAQVAVDWLEWQLRGDQAAGRTFTGPVCRLCTAPEWEVRRKGLDAFTF